MRVFVSGGAGVIGRELVQRLLARGDSVLVGDLQERPKEFPDTIEYLHGDLHRLTWDVECDVFYHLAATFERLGESPNHWDENYRHNVSLSHHLLNVIKAKRVVFASSYLVYCPLSGGGIWPRNLTAAAKLYTENEIGFLSKVRGFSASIGRIYRVYGKGSRDVISRWIRALLRGEEIEVYNPDSTYDYIYAGDVADLLVTMPEGTTDDIGTGRATLVYTLVQLLQRFFPDAKVKWVRERQPGHEKLESGITPWASTPLEVGIQSIIDYEKARCG